MCDLSIPKCNYLNGSDHEWLTTILVYTRNGRWTYQHPTQSHSVIRMFLWGRTPFMVLILKAEYLLYGILRYMLKSLCHCTPISIIITHQWECPKDRLVTSGDTYNHGSSGEILTYQWIFSYCSTDLLKHGKLHQTHWYIHLTFPENSWWPFCVWVIQELSN